MANSLTNLGEQICLMGTPDPNPTNGSIARIAAWIKLYTSVGNKDGTGFTEVDNGSGYTTNGQAVSDTEWTFSVVSTNGQIQLVDYVWTASGGSIANINGAYLTDAAHAVLAWWVRSSPVTLNDGDSITLDDLIIRLT